MVPILLPNDLLYFEKTNFRKTKVDDFILVKKSSHYFVHRVIYKSRSFLVTKGDGNLTSDGKIRPYQIIGRVLKVKRNDAFFRPESFYLIQSSHYFKELIKVKRLLDKSQVNYVFLKGLPLHLYYGKSHPKRLYADCDILVDKKDRNKVHRILVSLGYEIVDSSILKGRKTIISGPATSYKKTETTVAINFDVHYEVVFLMTKLGNLNSLYPQTRIDKLTEEFLESRKTVVIDGEAFHILGKYYLIIYLTLHFFHHNFKGVYRLEFLNTIIRKSRLKLSDWGFIANKINEYQLGNFTTPVIHLLKKYYGLTVPSRIIESVNYNRKEVYETVSCANVFDEEPRISAGVKRFKNIFILSPRPLLSKMLVFADPQVIYYVWFVLKRRLSYFSQVLSGNRQHPDSP